jgi:hypothetical protein
VDVPPVQRPMREYPPLSRHWPIDRQFNPSGKGATSLGQWLTAVFAMKGEPQEMSVPAAVAMIRATPPEKRSEFGSQIWSKKRERGTDRMPEVPF